MPRQQAALLCKSIIRRKQYLTTESLMRKTNEKCTTTCTTVFYGQNELTFGYSSVKKVSRLEKRLESSPEQRGFSTDTPGRVFSASGFADCRVRYSRHFLKRNEMLEILIKHEASGDRLGDYVSYHYTNLPYESGQNSLNSKTKSPRPDRIDRQTAASVHLVQAGGFCFGTRLNGG